MRRKILLYILTLMLGTVYGFAQDNPVIGVLKPLSMLNFQVNGTEMETQ